MTRRKASLLAAFIFAAVLMVAMTVIPSASVYAKTDYIGESKAKKAAFKKADVSSSKAESVTVKLRRSDDRYEYRVRFTSGNYEYDVRIDALNGKVRDYDREKIKAKATTKPAATSKPASSTYISESAAKKAAFKKADVSASDAESVSVNRKLNGSRYEYRVKFTSGNYKYEVRIDAINGDVNDYSRDKIKASDSAKTETHIGKTKAKSIAFKSANVTESDVKKLKVKLGEEKKKAVYSVKFRKGKTDYEYVINAVSGKIIKKDKKSVS